MHIVNEGALYSDRSKLSVAFYSRAQCIRGNTVGIVYAVPNKLYHHVTPVSLVYTVDGYLFCLNLSSLHALDILYMLAPH